MVAVPPPHDGEPADARLPLAVSVSGQVVAEDEPDQGLSGIDVYVESEDWGPWLLGGEAETGALGDFTVDGLHPDGTYSASFIDRDGEWARATYRGIEPPKTDWVVELAPGVAISGQVVVEGGGAGVGGLSVFTLGSGGGSAVTESDGTFSVGGLVADESYTMSVFDPDRNYITTDRVVVTAPDDDVTLVVFPTAVIAGCVSDSAGAPLADVDVRASLLESGNGWSWSTGADDDGCYELTVLASDDDYLVEVWGRFDYPDGSATLWPIGYYPGVSNREDAVGVVAGREDVDVVFDLGVAIAGRVIDEGGQPIDGVRVSATPEGSSGQRQARTNADGEYVIFGLEENTGYRVYFQDPDARFLDQYYDGQDSWWDADLVLAGATGIDLVLGSAATISGTVSDRDGEPLEGIKVSIRPVGQSGWSIDTWTTESDGTYVVAGLTDGGQYELRFRDEDDNFFTAYYDSVRDPGDATAVTAPSDGIDIVLDKAVSIGGTVTARADAAPLSGILVTVEHIEFGILEHSEGLEQRTTVTADDGGYEVSGLEEGVAYTVQASDGTRPRTTSLPTAIRRWLLLRPASTLPLTRSRCPARSSLSRGAIRSPMPKSVSLPRTTPSLGQLSLMAMASTASTT